VTDGARLVRLSQWWWSLTEERREEIRDEFLRKYENDPEFHARVREVLIEREEQLRLDEALYGFSVIGPSGQRLDPATVKLAHGAEADSIVVDEMTEEQ
jgi:hypothetical protein